MIFLQIPYYFLTLFGICFILIIMEHVNKKQKVDLTPTQLVLSSQLISSQLGSSQLVSPELVSPELVSSGLVLNQGLEKCTLVLVLDESGSMEPQAKSVIDGINELIANQKVNQELLDVTSFRLIKFNDRIREFKEQPLRDVVNLKEDDYQPQYSTALYDAIGRAIELYRGQENVIIAVATDGIENSSSRFTRQQVMEMIAEEKKNHKWAFIYLCEDFDSFEQGNNLGIHHSFNVRDGSRNVSVGHGNLGQYLGSQNHSIDLYAYRQYMSTGRSTVDPTDSSDSPKS